MKLGLIGYPLGHSWSPAIHKYLADADYELIPLQENEVQPFLQTKEYDGLNVTIPYKQTVIPLLDEIDENAAEIGAVNTIVKENGKYKGYNTDCSGFALMLKLNDIDVRGGRTAVLGSGGASKAVVHALKQLSSDPVIVSRTEKENCITYDELYERQEEFKVIVNTTPVGMYPNCDDTPIDLERFTSLTAVVDIIANPLRTRLSFTAKNKGLKTCSGFEMLAAQALYADEHFLRVKMPEERVTDCVNALLKERRNIVLIGMPTSGKTTISKRLGEILHKEPVEMDDEIVKILGTSIKACFQTRGETYFREIEKEVARENRQAEGRIISCGGGVIKNPETMRYLSENGIVIWINRDLKQLFPTDDRPLSADEQAVHKLYKERMPLYQMYSDIRIDNNGTIEQAIQEILERTGQVERT